MRYALRAILALGLVISLSSLCLGFGNELDREGGPDAFGYMFSDSDEPNGPEYEWVDISDTGTPITGWEFESVFGPFDIGFDFPFYGGTYDQFWVASGGWITFSPDQPFRVGWQEPIPSPNESPDNAIFWYGTWMFALECTAYYGDDGNGNCVIQMDFFGFEEMVQSEVILTPNGSIKIQFGPNHQRGNWDPIRIGIENEDGTAGMTVTDQQEEYVHTGLAIEFQQGEEDASVDGTVFDDCTQNAVEGAIVHYGHYETTTDVNGYYSFEEVFSISYTVRIEADGYDAFSQQNVVLESGENTVDFALQPSPQVTVDPNNFMFEMEWNGRDSDVLTISNDIACGADLVFNIDIVYPEEDDILTQAIRNNINNYRNTFVPTIGNTIAAGPTSDNPSFAGVKTEARFSELDEPYFLIIQDSDPWGGMNTHMEFLDQMEIAYDVINSGTMAEHDLGDYTVVLVPSCQGQRYYDTFANNQDRFEDFVSTGGVLEFHGCTQGSNWTLWDGTTYVSEGDNLNIVVAPDHPIALNVPDQFDGNSANHGWLNNISEDAIVIITDTQNRPVVIETPYGRGTMVVTSETWEWGARQGQGAGIVMQNAILYCAEGGGSASWLTVEPDEGIVEADHSIDLDVIVDAGEAELIPGVYEAEIHVESNALNGTEIAFVTLIVGHPGFVQGTVTDRETGDPIPEAIVTAMFGEFVVELITNDRGEYSASLEEGIWEFSANADWYYPSDFEEVQIFEGVTTTHDIELDHEIAPEFELLPEQLLFEVDWMSSATQDLTIGNIGGLDMNWNTRIEYLEEEEIDENRHNELDEGPYLLMGFPWTTNAIANSLQELEIEFDYFEGENYDQANLEDYRTIIIGSDDGRPTTAAVDAVLNFALDGGKLMMFGGGMPFADGYLRNDFINHDGHGWWIIEEGGMDHFTLLEPGHPLAADLPEVYNFMDPGNTIHTISYNDEDAEVAAVNGLGHNILVSKPVGAGLFLAFANTPAEFFWQNQADAAFLTTIVANMVDYNHGWLSLDPRNGFLAMEGTQEIAVTADAALAELDPGVYEAEVTFSADYEDAEDATLFITMIVNQPGTIAGTVVDADTDLPLEGAEVVIWENDEYLRSAFTDRDGHYEIYCGAGTWDVTANLFDYYESDLVEVVTQQGETTIQNFALHHEIPPTIDVDQEQITFLSDQYGSDEELLSITNNGGLPLNFRIATEYIDDEEIAARLLAGDNPFEEDVVAVNEFKAAPERILPSDKQLSKASALKKKHYEKVKASLDAKKSGKTFTRKNRSTIGNIPNHNELDTAGGPDEFGYRFMDSNEEGGPEFEWIDISETGTPITGWMDDVVLGPFDLDFEFPFYGEVYNQMWVCSNGWISFQPTMEPVYWWEEPLPIVGVPNAAIYWYWMDLFPDRAARSYYGTAPNGDFVIQFDFLQEDQLQVEVILRPNGAIIIQYGPDHNHEGHDWCRVAIENQDGTVALVADHEEGGIPNFPMANQAIAFFTNAFQTGWLTPEVNSGTIEVADDLTISLFADSEPDSLEEGIYEAIIEISSDHPDTRPTFVWAEYIVGAGGIFHPVPPNGRPYPIIISEVTIDGAPAPEGAGIGVFDGELCVGALTVNDEWPRSLLAWEADPEREIPGFTSGNQMTFKIWTEELGEMVAALPTYIEGDGNFGTDPFTHCTLNSAIVPNLNLDLQRNYFELISTCVVPENLAAESVFGDVNDLAIVYQDNGNIYLPGVANNIGDINPVEGYRLFCYETSSIYIEGELMDIETAYNLSANRWNWMGYPFYNGIAVDVALNEIQDDIQIVLTDDGRLWIPGIANTLGNMTPGEGYMVFVGNDCEFTYNANAMLATGTTEEIWNIPEVTDGPAPTGLPYPVLVSFTDELKGMQPASIEVYDGLNLVAKAVVLEDRDFTPVIAWEGNEDYNIAGFNAGNNMHFVIRGADGSKLPVVTSGNNENSFGEGAYGSVVLEKASMPTEFAVEQGYPNPFNPSVTVPFALPAAGEVSFAVYNVLGQQVFQMNEQYKAGFHSFVFDANNAGRELVSGMYFLQVNYEGSLQTQKIMLLK